MARGRGEGARNHREARVSTQRRQPTPQAECDVDGTPGIVRRPPPMRRRAAARTGLTPGAAARSAPGADAELELAECREITAEEP